MRPYLARQAATGRSGVAAIGVAQEFQRVCTAYQSSEAKTAAPQFTFAKADRRVTCYYFYLLGRRLRAGVHQGVRLFPVSGEDLGQRPRVGQAAGRPGRDRVHRAVQRVRRLRRPSRAAGDLRPARARRHPRCSPNAGAPSCRCR